MNGEFLKPPLIHRSHTTENRNSIIYRYNNKGFRCDDFDSYQNHPCRILFAGCSLTEGEGLSLEDTWAKQFHKMVCKEINLDIPYWNIAVAGTGLDQLVRYLYHEGNILRPQIIVSYLPFLERRELYHNKSLLSNMEIDSNNKIFFQEEYVNYQTEKNLIMIDSFLKNWESYMFITPCDYRFNLDYMNLERDSQTMLNLYTGPDDIDYAKDNIHPGPKTNKIFAEKAFEQFWPNIRTILKC